VILKHLDSLILSFLHEEENDSVVSLVADLSGLGYERVAFSIFFDLIDSNVLKRCL